MNTNTNNNTENNNNTDNFGNEGGGAPESPHPTSREWVSTNTIDEKKAWWDDFRKEVLRKYNEQAITSGNAINQDCRYKNLFTIDKNAIIDDDGNIVDAINNESSILAWQSDNYIKDINALFFMAVNAKNCFTKRLGSQLCKDLGVAKIKWDDCKDKSLSEYLTKIYNILSNSNEMPKVRHRHRGNDNESKANSRWLKDYIDFKGELQWAKLGSTDEERKEALVKMAKDEEKGKKLYKLLKIKGRKFEDIWNERVAVVPANTQMTAIPPGAQFTQTVVPQIVTPTSPVEKIKLYPGASQEWKKKLPWWDRFSDWLNRKWFRFRFKNEIYNDEAGYKAAYENCCNRDWDTGAPTR